MHRPFCMVVEELSGILIAQRSIAASDTLGEPAIMSSYKNAQLFKNPSRKQHAFRILWEA